MMRFLRGPLLGFAVALRLAILPAVVAPAPIVAPVVATIASASITAAVVSVPLAATLAPQVAEASIVFDGTNDNLTGTFTTSYNSEPLTLACWIKVTTHPVATDTFINLGNSSSSVNQSQRLRSNATDDSWDALSRTTGDNQATVSVNIDATWAGIVGTFTNDHLRNVYVAAIGNTASDTNTRAVTDPIVNLRFGEHLTAGDDFLGRLAECAVWDAVITTQNITDYLDAAIAPTFTAAPAAGTITPTTIPTTFTTDYTGNVYGTACANGTAGNATETQAGQCSGGGAAAASFTEPVTGGVADGHTFTGLSEVTTYDLSFVAKRTNIISTIDSADMVGYWPFSSNGDLTNQGTDATGDLTAGGNAAWDSDQPNMTPVSSQASVADQTTTSSCSGSPTITDVDTDESVTATQTNVVITGTNFCASGTVTIRQNGNSKTLSQDSYSDTSIQVDMSGVGMGVANGLMYGSADIRVANQATNTDDQAITVTAPSGTIYADLSGGLVTLAFDDDGNPNRVFGDPIDVLPASQVALRNASGCTLSTDVTINTDGTLLVDESCTSFDYDFTDDSGASSSHQYIGTTGTINWAGGPPHYGGIDITDHVLAVNLAMTGYDVDDYFVPGDAAITARALRRQTNPTDTTTDVNGAVTASLTLVVDDASVLNTSVGKYIRCATGVPVQIKYVNPLTNTIGVRSPITCADNAQVDVYTDGAGSVSQVTVNSGTGAVSGTPDTDATTTLLVYRETDASGLSADVRIPFQIDVVTIPDVTADDLATGTAALEALGITVENDGVCSNAEAVNEILSQTESSALWNTVVLLDYVGSCGSPIFGVGLNKRLRHRGAMHIYQ